MTTDRSPSSHLFAGRFRLGALLGTGGSASVFEAVDAESGAAVALKVLHPHLARTEALRVAFLGEADRVGAVDHPAVARVVAQGMTDGATSDATAWIALERVRGVTLAELVVTRGPLAPAPCIEVGLRLLEALSAVHRIGLVHRDISPSNVMVEIDGERVVGVKVLDFGLADAAGGRALGGDVLRSSRQGVGGVVANVRYASPEQLRGDAVDERGDLYHVGGVLHFALTGSPPFTHTDHDAVVRAHLDSPPPVPSVLARGVSAHLDRVVVRALLKDPADRFPDASAMHAALSAARPASHRPRLPGTVLADMDTRTRVLDPPSAERDEAADGSRSSRPAGVGVWVIVTTAVALAVGLALPAFLPAATIPVADAVAPPPPVSPSPTASTVPAETTPPPPVVRVVVPTAATLAELRTALDAAGLLLGEVAVADSPHRSETLLSTSPAPGTELEPGSIVTASVASGANVVPDVAGSEIATASRMLREAGFEVRESLVSTEEIASGYVIVTTPAERTSAAVGSVVWLYVAAAPVRPTPSPTPATPTPTPTP